MGEAEVVESGGKDDEEDEDALLEGADEEDVAGFFGLSSVQPATTAAHISRTTGSVRRRFMAFPRESCRVAEVGCQL